MKFLRKIWPEKVIHGKNLGKEFKTISLKKLKYDENFRKYICPVCKKGMIRLQNSCSKGTCSLCGQSFLFK